MDVPAHDNHFHCRPDGWKGLQAVREFQAAGGTSILHVRLPTYPTSVEAFQRSCEEHLAFSDRIRKETGLRVWSAVGPYPLEPMRVAESRGWEEAEAFGRACYEVAARLCAEGRAHCLGEVGRAHYEVPAEVQERNNALLRHGMALAKDAGVPVMLHTEHAEPATMAEFAAMADGAGLPRDRVIKHYCGALTGADEHHGLVPSVIAGRSNIRPAIEKARAAGTPGRFLLETDYIDEPSRPNVVMPCDTVPKRVRGLVQNQELSEAEAWSIGSGWPERLFGA
ncbi:MAG TPA: TatD family hydrolase [Candidatus Thermoplasmatota archaeon]|nr:TatD family hydrolase [Candidatus Thermoplasmatota archaeon]